MPSFKPSSQPFWVMLNLRTQKNLNPEKARASFLAVFLPGLIIPFCRQIFQKLLELDLRYIFQLKKFGLFRDSAITWPTVNLVLALKNSSSWEKMAAVINRLMSELTTPMWHLLAKDNDFRLGRMRKFRFFNFSLFDFIIYSIIIYSILHIRFEIKSHHLENLESFHKKSKKKSFLLKKTFPLSLRWN